MLGDSGNDINSYTLSTAWNVSTVTFDSIVVSIATESTSPRGIEFNPTGTKMFILDDVAPEKIYEYTLSTAWDVTTATH